MTRYDLSFKRSKMKKRKKNNGQGNIGMLVGNWIAQRILLNSRTGMFTIH